MHQDEKFFESYKLLIGTRNFHYDNFSKWMTFYYVAVAAIFVAFYTSKPCDETRKVLPILGLCVSILWHLSCKGYYFWIKNWTKRIEGFEKKIEKDLRIHSVFSKYVKEKENKLFVPTQSANISTSKATLLFSFAVTVAWAYLTISLLIENNCSPMLRLIISILSAYSLIILTGLILKSNLKKHELVV